MEVGAGKSKVESWYVSGDCVNKVPHFFFKIILSN